MKITHYFRYIKEQGSKTKYILEKFTNVYEPLLNKSKKDEYVIYLSQKPYFINSKSERKPLFSLDTIKPKSIDKDVKSFHTGLYNTKDEIYYYGDFNNDLILVNCNGYYLEIYISENSKIYTENIYSKFTNLDFDFLDCINEITKKATNISVFEIENSNQEINKYIN